MNDSGKFSKEVMANRQSSIASAEKDKNISKQAYENFYRPVYHLTYEKRLKGENNG